MKQNLFSQVFTLGLAVVALSGCVHLNSLSLTSIPENRNQKVSVEKEKVIFLGFNFDNDFISEINSDLIRQCPNGKVTGLLTKDENVDYFLYIVWKKRVNVSGYCVPGAVASSDVVPKAKGKH